jgi:hypothetical protein
MRRLAVCAVMALNIAAPPSPAWSGIADTPLPQFSDGTTGVVVYSVTGVTKRTRLQTDFLCTSFAVHPVHVGVEVFAADGARMNDVHAGVGAVLNVAPGQTVTIGTSATAAFLETSVIPLVAVSQGSARVVATSERVRCNAIVLDDAVTPPTSVATLVPGTQPVVGSLIAVPLPTFANGRKATHAALIPGVIKRGRVQTDIFCTSLAASDIDIGVEIYAPDGAPENLIGAGNGALLNVRPGATVTFGTTGSAAFLETSVITARGVAQGYARVVSTSGALTCAALMLDAAVTPPTSMATLAIPEPSRPGDVNRDGVVDAADLPALIDGLYR